MRKILSFFLILSLLCSTSWAGVDFDNADDLLSCGTMSGLTGTTSVTVSMWVYHDSSNTDDYIISWAPAVGGVLMLRDDVDAVSGRTDSYTIFIQESSGAGSGTIRFNSSTNSGASGSWKHLLFTFTANAVSGFRFYVNGSEDSQSPINTTNVDNITSSGTWYLGLGVTTLPFDGVLNEIAVWNTVLTAQERLILANSKMKRIGLQIQPSNLKAYWVLDSVSDGNSADGATFVDISGNANTCTGDNGANNTGLTGKAEAVLSYA